MLACKVRRKSAKYLNKEFKPNYDKDDPDRKSSPEDIARFKILLNMEHPYEISLENYISMNDEQLLKYFTEDFIQTKEFKDYLIANLEHTNISFLEKKLWLLSDQDFQNYIIFGGLNLNDRDIDNIIKLIAIKTGEKNLKIGDYPIRARKVVISFILSRLNIRYIFTLNEKQKISLEILKYYYRDYSIDPAKSLMIKWLLMGSDMSIM